MKLAAQNRKLRLLMADMPLASIILLFFSVAFMFLFVGSWTETYSFLSKSQIREGVGVIKVSESRFHRTSATQGKGTGSYVYVVSYKYSVNGKSYSSDKLSFAESNFVGEPQNYVGKYPVGALVTVYYLQSNPSIAALEQRWGGGQWVFPSLLFVAVLSLLVNGWSRRFLKRQNQYTNETCLED